MCMSVCYRGGKGGGEEREGKGGEGRVEEGRRGQTVGVNYIQLLRAHVRPEDFTNPIL